MLAESNDRDAYHFSRRLIACTSLGLALVATLNFLANPYAQYGTHLLPPLVQTSRAEKLRLFAAQPSPPQGLILGSSRVLKLEPQYLQQKTGLRFFNAGVNYGRVEDCLAWLRLYEQRYQSSPQMVVLGIDIGSLSSAPVDARLLNQKELSRQIPEAIRIRDRLLPIQELFSWKQMRSSLISVKQNWQGAPHDQRRKDEVPDDALPDNALPEERRTDDELPDEFYLENGLLVYREREAAIAAGTYNFEDALRYNQREYRAIFQNETQLDPLRCSLLQELASHCRRRSIPLIAFVTPMHPELSAYLRDHTGYTQQKECVWQWLRGLSEAGGFPLIDFSDISSFEGSAELFVDGIHPLEPNTRRMIDRLVTLSTASNQYAVQ